MLTAGACWALQTGSKLFVEGQLASSDVRVINGTRYVPLKDVAAALHLHIVPQSGGINLTHEGGANQVEGLHGAIGDAKEIFTGKWRFWARSIEKVDSYTLKYSTEHEKITPRNAGEVLYVIDCRIKNGTSEKQAMILRNNMGGHDALTDDMEHSFEPFAFDAHNENGAFGGPTLLPGAAGEFAVIFSAPAGTNPKDFVFTIQAAPGDVGKGTDLRIAIPKQ
jgi:hypothetical protein